jgi:hypothetical protein
LTALLDVGISTFVTQKTTIMLADHKNMKHYSLVVNSFTTIRFWQEQKTSAPYDFYGRKVQKVPSTTNTTIHKHHHHGGAVCPSYGVGSIDLPTSTDGWPSEGFGQGRCCGVLYVLMN